MLVWKIVFAALAEFERELISVTARQLRANSGRSLKRIQLE
jgi:hypothetical protein